jgi:hypothetical protein
MASLTEAEMERIATLFFEMKDRPPVERFTSLYRRALSGEHFQVLGVVDRLLARLPGPTTENEALQVEMLRKHIQRLPESITARQEADVRLAELMRQYPEGISVPITPEVREWVLRQHTDEEMIAGLAEARKDRIPMGQLIHEVEKELHDAPPAHP